MNKEELLYNEIYERTKDFGRTQFVREIMRLQRENKELQQKVNQLETNRDEAIEYIEKDYYSGNTIDINSIGYTTNKFLKIKQLLERGKEDV